MSSTVVSCPGKVLIAGGYLVLDPAYHGYVVATASRFYTVVVSSSSASNAALRICARSPQFEAAEWSYECRLTSDGADCQVAQTDSKPRNPFLQIALGEALRVVLAINSQLPTGSLDIAVLGDNDFYSQDRSRKASEPVPFARLNTTLADVHKTGLGSSAAMVTSLVGGLLSHCGIDVVHAHRADLHNLAQYAHSLAQGKVGSGFDVSAAVYGNQRYRRFSPSNLPDLAGSPELTAKDLYAALGESTNPVWTSAETKAAITPFTLPPFTALLLADVDMGSNTPSMVSKVLAWRKANVDEAKRLWDDLSAHNDDLAGVFGDLSALAEADEASYREAVRECASWNELQWAAADDTSPRALLRRLRRTIASIRAGMKHLGEAADVPIEPAEQSALLDAVQRDCPCVLGGGVPGAGGYDAVWVLCLAPSLDALDPVERALAAYPAASVRPLSKAARVLGPRGVRDEGQSGVQVEDLAAVPGLAAALGVGTRARGV